MIIFFQKYEIETNKTILAQILSLKQRKNFAFIKSVFPSINNSFLSTEILAFLILTKK
jgi:hypothetical protein